MSEEIIKDADKKMKRTYYRGVSDSSKCQYFYTFCEFVIFSIKTFYNVL